MKNSVSERIIQFLNTKNIDPLAFMKDLGYGSIGNYNRLISGKWAPSKILLRKMKDAYPELNFKWIATGLGDMIIENKNHRQFAYDNQELACGVKYIEEDERQELARLRGENTRLLEEVKFLRELLLRAGNQ